MSEGKIAVALAHEMPADLRRALTAALSAWEDLLDRFDAAQMRLITVPLELSEEYGGNDGLHIVRAIVPGLVPMTFGYRQEPAGMKRVYQVAEGMGGKALSYGELTKFPHPFE